MPLVTNLTLAATLSLAAHFHGGLESLQARKYDAAVTELSQVVDAKPAVAEVTELARLYRAQAWLQLGKKEPARADLKLLITTTTDAARRRQALDIFRQADGDAKALLPHATPSQTWLDFGNAARVKDVKAAFGFLAPAMQKALSVMDAASRMEGAGEGMLPEMLSAVGEVKILGEVVDAVNGRATLTVGDTESGHPMAVPLELTLSGDRWLISGIGPRAPAVGDAGEMVAEAAPEEVAQADDAPPQAMLTVNGVPQVIQLGAVQNNLPMPGGAIVVNGGAWAGGVAAGTITVQMQAGGRPPTAARASATEVKKDSVPAARQEEIRRLIRQLGAEAPAERAAAKAGLQAIGAPARPFLREELQNADPEIALTVKEILGP